MATVGDYYVYLLIDPRDGKPFYIGKGKGERISFHVRAVKRGHWDNGVKCSRIAEILACGLDVVERFHTTGLTESAAFALERRLIRTHREHLTNITSGVVTHRESTLAKAIDMRGRIKSFRAWVCTCQVRVLRGIVERYGCPLTYYHAFINQLDEDIDYLRQSLNLIEA